MNSANSVLNVTLASAAAHAAWEHQRAMVIVLLAVIAVYNIIGCITADMKERRTE